MAPLLSPVSKAELFTQTLVITPHWLILSLFLLLHSSTQKLCFRARTLPGQTFPYLPIPPILAGSMSTYNLFQRRVTTPIPQTTVLLLWFPAILKSLNLSLTGKFRGIYPLTNFFLIVSMASNLYTLLAISGFPYWLLVTLFGEFRWNFCCCLRYIKNFWEFGIKLWFLSVLFSVSILSAPLGYPLLKLLTESLISLLLLNQLPGS